MLVNGQNLTSLWWDDKIPESVFIIDQRKLPFELVIEELKSVEDVYTAIKDMHLRGAPLIGGAAAWGMYFAALAINDKENFNTILEEKGKYLKSARPTAVNLEYAVESVLSKSVRETSNSVREMSNSLSMSKEEEREESVSNSVRGTSKSVRASKEERVNGERVGTLRKFAVDFCNSEVEACRLIGLNGLPIIEEISKQKHGEVVNILTHCNAGWLACINYGTATAPIYAAHDKGIKVHVWVDETRPLNQGSKLTAWELGQHGVPYTIIADNTGGHIMQSGMVDMCIVGSDRTTRSGDVANKIGTYLKALAAKDNNIPFYVALPSSTIDFSIKNGIKEIPIEERDADELHFTDGLHEGKIIKSRITPKGSKALNYGFDITPARLITGLITESGICKSSEEGIKNLFPEKLSTKGLKNN